MKSNFDMGVLQWNCCIFSEYLFSKTPLDGWFCRINCCRRLPKQLLKFTKQKTPDSIKLDCFTSWIDWYFFYFFYSILIFSFIRNLRIAILIFYVWRWIYFMVLWSQSLRFMNSNDRWKVWTAGLLHEIRFHILLKFQFVR